MSADELETAWFVVLALVTTACAVYVLNAVVPLRRQERESWYSYYFRLYWAPGSVVAIAAFGWSRSLGWGLEDLDLLVYVWGTVWCVLLTVGTYARKSRRGY